MDRDALMQAWSALPYQEKWPIHKEALSNLRANLDLAENQFHLFTVKEISDAICEVMELRQGSKSPTTRIL